MSPRTRYRDAASVHVAASPERVTELIAEPSILRALDPRLADEDVEVLKEGSKVEVLDRDGHLRVAFNLSPDGEGTQVSAMESVVPSGPIERTKHMLFPGHVHDELQDELKRLRILIEALDSMPRA